MKSSFFIVYLLLRILTNVVTAQKFENLKFEYPKLENGKDLKLPATVIFEDSKNYIWIGSLSGLYKYDGNQLQLYINNTKDSFSISDNKIAKIVEDKKGNLWIGTQNGLNKYDPTTNRFYRYTDTSKHGISITGIGLMNFDIKNNLIIYANNNFYIQDTLINKFHIYQTDLNLNKNEYVKGFEFIKNYFLVKTNKGLYIKDINSNNKFRWVPADNTKDSLNMTFVDSHVDKNDDSIVWVGTNTGLYKLDLRDPSILQLADTCFEKDVVISINSINSSHLIIGAYGKGLYIYEKNTRKKISYQPNKNDPNALFHIMFNRGFISSNNILWLYGANGEIFKTNINNSQFNKITLSNSNFIKNIPELPQIFEYNKDSLLIQTINGKFLLSLNSKELIPFPYRPNFDKLRWEHTNMICFLKDKEKIWIGTCNGLFLFDRKLMAFENIKITLSKELEFKNICIRNIFKDKKGNLWISSWAHGIFKFDFNTNSLKNYIIEVYGVPATRTIFQDSKNNIWIGTRGGLLKYIETRDSFKIYKNDPQDPSTLSENTAFSIYEDKDSFLWIGTYGGGLNKMNMESESFINFTKNDGLPDNNILSIYPDKYDNFWISTFWGLSYFNKGLKTFKNFNKENGLLNDHFPSFTHGISDINGILYFLGEDGIDYFHPDSITLSNYKVPIYITDLKLFNKSVPIANGMYNKDVFTLDKDISVTKELKLLYDQNVITFDYVALDYTGPQNILYAYKLEGFDKEWQYVGKQRSVTYTNLNPGKYNLKVKATNADGVWNDDPKELMIIKVSPPWWRTWWAYMLYLIFIVSGISGYIRFKNRSLINQNKILEERVGIRTQELNKSLIDLKNTQTQLIQSEKMASLGELTSGIAHEIKNPLNFINNFSEVNIELLDELENEDLSNLPDSVKANINTLLENLKKNSSIINQHGYRIDGIVKSMLQHSSGGSTAKESLNINTICEEASKLAYHGFKAKERSFECEVDLQFDSAVPLVSGIPQDISRVVLNILNNAFYTVHKKKSSSGQDGYFPKVRIKTEKSGSKVKIIISDNGSGIAENIIQKIFQPFYTTKPTGEGTGLGLSLAYDIITKVHGGEVKVNSPSKIFIDCGCDFEIII